MMANCVEHLRDEEVIDASESEVLAYAAVKFVAGLLIIDL